MRKGTNQIIKGYAYACSCNCCGRSSASPTSSILDDRLESKVDALLHFHGARGRDILEQLDEHYMRHHGHAQPHGHDKLDEILEGKRRTLD